MCRASLHCCFSSFVALLACMYDKDLKINNKLYKHQEAFASLPWPLTASVEHCNNGVNGHHEAVGHICVYMYIYTYIYIYIVTHAYITICISICSLLACLHLSLIR